MKNLLPACVSLLLTTFVQAQQVIAIDGTAPGKRFDGIGAVSGGGATSVLLKDYPLEQRNQILDLVFRPKFGASISSLYVEVGSDGNSTQGAEPSHMHTRADQNYSRGYEWWLMTEAKKRNPDLSLDACAWGCPGWVGHGDFWSQDMCDYYVKWIKGLKTHYGLTLDSIGCRNERGSVESFVKKFRHTLNCAGLQAVKIHAFDNAGRGKWDWVADLTKDPQLAASVDILGNHTLTRPATPPLAKELSEQLHKPIWDTEEHVYKKGFDCEISIVQAFNQNYIHQGATKIVNWYLIDSTYGVEPYTVTPSMLVANDPWGGHYDVREALWGYAHYGQFCKIGWQYVPAGCQDLAGGGSVVTLKSPATEDYSAIFETKAAIADQAVVIHVGPGLSQAPLCVWKSDADAQFVRHADIQPVNGTVQITLSPHAIYSLSTTTGQQKGSFANVPPAADFPFPYRETFKHYSSAKAYGYLPHYTADIAGDFELSQRPDGAGMCLQQVVDHKAQSWAPEWAPYTILGDPKWRDYDLSANVNISTGGWAALMGHVSGTGNGWYGAPRGIYMRLDEKGRVSLRLATANQKDPEGKELAAGQLVNFVPAAWHHLKLRFIDDHITGFVDGHQVVSAENGQFPAGVVGLATGGYGNARNSAWFDDVIVKEPGGADPPPTVFPQDANPIYRG